MKETRPFSMKDKIGYTLGDLGCCCTEQFRAMYLAIFYTLVLKVNPVHVGILMLITKFWDAINDPLIGALVDSHKNKGKGKFIPWIKFFSNCSTLYIRICSRKQFRLWCTYCLYVHYIYCLRNYVHMCQRSIW